MKGREPTVPAPAGPLVVVLAGGGGVGKTTTSAGLALALARQGHETLIVTIDPARRLAGALGVALTDEVSRVPIAAAGGRLAALMPDPRRSLGTFVRQLFEHEPEARARMLENRIYVGLADAAAGVHELVAMNLVAQASASFEVVVIDTAPSRHAIDFVTLPGRLAALLGGRTVDWLARMADRASRGAGEASSGGILSWGTGQVEALLARVTGPYLVRDTASLFGDLAIVRERFVALAGHAGDLLLGPRTAYALVAAPTAAARDDVLFLAHRLKTLGRAPRAVILNRADAGRAPHELGLLGALDLPGSVLEALHLLGVERGSRARAADAMVAELSAKLARLPIVRLPHLELGAPAAIVAALAEELHPHTSTLLPARS